MVAEYIPRLYAAIRNLGRMRGGAGGPILMEVGGGCNQIKRQLAAAAARALELLQPLSRVAVIIKFAHAQPDDGEVTLGGRPLREYYESVGCAELLPDAATPGFIGGSTLAAKPKNTHRRMAIGAEYLNGSGDGARVKGNGVFRVLRPLNPERVMPTSLHMAEVRALAAAAPSGSSSSIRFSFRKFDPRTLHARASMVLMPPV